MEITKEQQLLLELLKENLLDMAPSVPEELLCSVNWEAVFKEARQQAVTLQAFDAAGKYRSWIPKEIYGQWFQWATRVMQNNLRVQQAQNELVALLEKHGYPYVILKGTAAASYYPKPELRTLGDVDFLIDPKQKEEIGQMLEQAGYEESGDTHVCHVVYRKPGAHLEMHFEPAGIPHGKPGTVVRSYFVDTVQSGDCYIFEGSRSVNPKEAKHALILLLHIQHHMLGEGLGLRHLCDWAAFVQKTKQMNFWGEEVLPLLREIGLFRFASIMTSLAETCFGINCPTWAAAENEIVEQVLDDILTGGNFGRKEKVRSSAGMMISNHGKDGVSHGTVWYLYHTLHQSSEQKYPRVKGHPIRHFFVDVVRAIRYLILTMLGKRESLLEMYPHAMERKEIYRQLGLFEVE